MTGRTPEELPAAMRAEAAQSVARELALEAVADGLGIEVSDEEVEGARARAGRGEGDDPEAVIEELWATGDTSACARTCACAPRSTGSPPR